MEESNQTYFIVDTYSRFHKNDDVRMIFSLHNNWYCIREVEDLNWGQPLFDEKDPEDGYTNYHIYVTLEEAQSYVRGLRKMEGVRI